METDFIINCTPTIALRAGLYRSLFTAGNQPIIGIVERQRNEVNYFMLVEYEQNTTCDIGDTMLPCWQLPFPAAEIWLNNTNSKLNAKKRTLINIKYLKYTKDTKDTQRIM